MKRIALFIVLASACIAQPLQFVDRYQGTLASGYTSGGGTLSITSATSTVGSAVLPSGTSYYFLNVRAEGANTDELFLVTSRSGTTLTVTGAQSSTSASNHASGAVITATIMTAAAYAQFALDVLINPAGALSVAFASLGSPSNGAQRPCSDCKVTSSIDDTCAGSGSGAQAFRVNGAWKCVY